MGDTGSMIIGFIVSVLSIAVINASSLSLELPLDESLPLIGAVLAVPLYDTIKVFVLRLSKGQSPFYPDRSHIHHSLLKIGLNHGQATLTLLLFTLFQIWVAYTFSMSIGMNLIIPILIVNVILFGLVIDRLVLKKKFMGSNVVVNNSPEISESKRGS